MLPGRQGSSELGGASCVGWGGGGKLDNWSPESWGPRRWGGAWSHNYQLMTGMAMKFIIQTSTTEDERGTSAPG